MALRRYVAIAVGGLALVAAACGSDDGTAATNSPDTTDTETRTVAVEMSDNAFSPTAIDVEKGETVRFTFTNTGDVAHDAFVGDAEAQAGHEEEMQMDDMGGDSVTIEPGDMGELTYTFDQAGPFEVGCHQPGHYASGMKIDVTVS